MQFCVWASSKEGDTEGKSFSLCYSHEKIDVAQDPCIDKHANLPIIICLKKFSIRIRVSGGVYILWLWPFLLEPPKFLGAPSWFFKWPFYSS